MSEKHLTACPFCGSTSAPTAVSTLYLVTANTDDREFTILCDNEFNEGCGATGPYRATLSEAQNAWINRKQKSMKDLYMTQEWCKYKKTWIVQCTHRRAVDSYAYRVKRRTRAYKKCQSLPKLRTRPIK